MANGIRARTVNKSKQELLEELGTKLENKEIKREEIVTLLGWDKYQVMVKTIEILLAEVKKLGEVLADDKNNTSFYCKSEDELAQEYQEAWQDPQRITEAKQWEQAAMNDWAERVHKKKK